MSKKVGRDRWQWLLLLCGGCLGVFVSILIGLQTVRFGDAADYLAGAQALVNGLTYPREASLPFFRPPLYPLLIASAWALFPGSVVAIKLIQALLFGLTCWLLYRLGKVLFNGDARPALIGAFLYAVNPFALLQVTDIQTECLHTFLIALGLYFLAVLLQSKALLYKYALFAGIAFGLASLCRPTAFPIGVALALGLLAMGLRNKQIIGYLKSSSIMAAGIVLTILPWSMANLSATGEFIFLTDAGGYHFWLGNHPAELRIYEGGFRNQQEFESYSYNYLQQELPGVKMKEWENSGGYKTLSLKQREAMWQRAAIQNVRSNSSQTIRLLIYKTFAYWRPWLLPGAYSRAMVVTSGVILVSLYLLASLGALIVYQTAQNRLLLGLLLLLFAVSTVIHTLSHVMMRFRLPYVDPYLSVLAGITLWQLFLLVTSQMKLNHQVSRA